jgi:phosphoribosyl-ATP pyrophosphohydrolase/phosphoribosyl-AMP cyclohydrolase
VTLALPEKLVFGESGLLPVVVQERRSGDVLMLAWANAEALERSVESGLAHFWSRSRQKLWRKGETSGNELRVRELRADCDGDTLLMVVDPVGPTCHTGSRTCFGDDTPSLGGLVAELARVIEDRAEQSPDASYTARLFAKGLDYSLKKIGEESTEVLLAAKGEGDERLAEEAADLVFHLLGALRQRGVEPTRFLEVLKARRKP